MNKKVVNDKSHGIKTLVVYGILVFCVILISLFIRIISVVKDSKFDGQHRYTLVVGENNQAYGLISIEPITSSLSLLTFSRGSHLPFDLVNRTAGIMPDGYIKTHYPLVLEDTIPTVLQSFIFHFNSISSNINAYDLLQFWFYSNKIPSSTVSLEEMPVSADERDINKTSALLFSDSIVISENVSIQIINAAGKSGLGSRLERAISNLGGNVVSVETAKKDEPYSKIQFNRETYTSRKLSSLLSYRLEKLDKRALSEIIIIIGRDNKDTTLY